MNPPRPLPRLAASAAVGAATVVVAYALLRTVERALLPEPNPAIVIWSERSAFAWRAAVALWLGVLGAIGGFALARRSLEPASRTAAVLAALGPIWLVLQSFTAP
jgi:hypothetical protein